ncbi:MAG TPA: serine hydrolase [Gemmatimonadaceae bacterium]|nr:serine hydrolase [Gemmatimonadaceae bacterium]
MSAPLRVRFVTVVLALCAPSLLSPQQPVPADLPSRIDGVFARFTRTVPGCGVGLSKDGRPLYTHGYGASNLEYGVLNSDSTVFESGSVAKQFTASALVLLAQDGKLSLDDDIRKYLPEVPRFGGQRIAIRNLLTHTSGLRDQWGLLGIEGRGPGTQIHSPMTTLDLVVHQKMLNFPPGSEYLYSNTGYALAALIVERVSGKSLSAFTEERLFRPLGMTHTQWRDDFTKVVPNRATAYSGSEQAGFKQDMPFTNMIGNGGVLSTMSDLLRWNENLDHPTVGGQGYVDTMQTRMRLTSGRTITYALGLQVLSYNGMREISHSGSTAGYSTYLTRFPDQHVSVAVWCNLASSNPTALAHQVADLVLPRQTHSAGAAIAERTEVAPAELARWQALYRDPHTDQAVTLTASRGALTSDASGRGGRGGILLAPAGGNRYRGPQGDAQFSGEPGKRRFTLVRAESDTAWFEEALPARPSASLSDYAGTYSSDELDVRFTVVARDGKLFLKRRPADEFELRPAYGDDFQSGGGLGTVRFARDASGPNGRVTGFAFFAGRVLDVRFKRVKE